jgi:hypothetical protein
MAKTIKLTIVDEDLIEMERIKSRDKLTDDELFSYLLRLDAVADMDSLTPTERRHQVERAKQVKEEMRSDKEKGKKGKKKQATAK